MNTSVKTKAEQDWQAIFSALGDERRYLIVRLLADGGHLCVSEVASEVGISVAGVSQHMRVLQRAGLVKPKRTGQKICYQLNQSSPSVSKIFKMIEEDK